MPRLTPLFVATTSVAVIVSAFLWQQLRIARESNAQLQDRVTQLQIGLQREQQNESQARAAAAAVAPPLAAAPASVAAPPVAAPAQEAKAAGNSRRSVSINIRDLLKDPDYREAQRVQLRMTMPQRYPDLARELGLSPAEAAALFDLLAKQQVEQLANSFGPDDSEAARQEAMRAAGERVRNQQTDVENLLGPARYQQWQEYQQTLGPRLQVSQLRTTLSTAGYPLTDDQAAPLLNAFNAEQKRRADETRGRTYPADPRARLDYQEGNLKAQEDSNRRVLDAAQSYLTSEQLAALKNTMTQQLGMVRAFLKLQRAQLEAGGSQGAAGGNVVNAP